MGEHPPEMVGVWQLLIRDSCDRFGVASDTLVLHADGTFDQHVALADGKKMELIAQHWSYDDDEDHGHIVLNQRLEFFLPDIFGTRVGEATKTGETLIVQTSPEVVILLNPDWDCVYFKAQ